MDSRLREAALQGNVSSLLQLLQEDPLILDRGIGACITETPLHIASVLGHVHFVRVLLSNKPKLALKPDESQGHTPLHLASAKGHVEVVKELLLPTGMIDVCISRDRDGRTPLHLAAMKGQAEVVEVLAQAIPEVTRVLVDGGGTILHLCVKHGQLEVLELLLRLIGDVDFVNHTDGDGNIVLHLAVANKQIEMVRFLLEKTAIKVNSVNNNSFTALDVLTNGPRDLMDMDMEEALRGAGALRFRDIPPTAHHHTTSTHPVVQISLAAQHDQVIHERQMDSKLRKKPRNHEDWVEKKRGTLMVVASLIATMAFQAGVNPPGGVWQDSSDNSTNAITPPHTAGTSVMADMYPDTFHRFVNCNTLGLIASLSIILLLVSGLPMRHRIFVWILMVAMWIAITAMTLTYLMSLDGLASESDYETMFKKLVIVVVVWLCVMVLLLLIHTIRLLKRGLKKLVKLLRRKRNQSINV
ncbi:PREDICTED: ankyrin repeat-containing protein ITN1-like [Nelumbo nucifera]|uniref:PGG domain-containing protein n=2 Tax=Nelumbo nucifera TaxID=4432 RepID=A0A822YV13_NELNU|nr:PREDICTED: ankyrin repeat-containing protein ITN1-like [Nelumbo nucifera]DAD36512.1 TPA_asm: hypothetical protein HUJ06_007153 [Nelumbo nucifera]